MDVISYALSKKIAEHAVSGVQSMSVSGQTLTINTKDSGVLTMTFPTPKDGVSVTDIDVNANNQIVFTMSDGSEFISGKIPTVKGEPGFSPTITENADNTDKIYKLDITTADSTFTTPNLKGADGQDGSGEENTIESISVNGVDIPPDKNKNVDITVPSIDGLTKDADLATVAKSGDYKDLTNKPEIPDITGLATETYVDNKVADYTKTVDLADVAISGSYNDLVDKPAIPSLDGYAKTSEIPSKVSELINDSNYQTAEQVNSTVTTEIAKVVADAPEDLNTLKEMSDWIAGHEDDASAMNSAISDNKTAITALQTGKADKSEIPTTVAELTDSSSYAKKTDIPTTLPANGGNADTVNNHTVETDVPTDAVFTDTVYDDTELKGRIDELSSNLDGLEYGEVAGGKNLFDKYKVINATIEQKNGNECLKYTDGENCFSFSTDFKNDTQYTFTTKLYRDSGGDGTTIKFNYTDGTTSNIWFPINNLLSITSVKGKTVSSISGTWNMNKSVYIDLSVTQLEEGTTASPYKPYIPSVKMLAKEVSAQNDNLDGLGYGENGAKNLFKDYDVMQSYTISSETYNGYPVIYSNDIWLGAYQSDLILKSGVTYTISAYIKGNGRAYLFSTLQSTYITDIELTDNFERFSVVYTPNEDIKNIRIENGTDGGLYIACFQIEEGDTATPYKPYIPSVKMLAEEVSAQNESLDTLEYSDVAGGKNLYDRSKEENGYINSQGVDTENDDWRRSYFIPITSGKPYTITVNSNRSSLVFHEWCDKNKSFISNIPSGNAINVVSPSNAQYLRIAYNKTSTNVQVEQNTQATEYEPYIPSVKMLAEENAQQNTESMDLKMLGWTVPSECPVQNEVSGNQFIQKVGRVKIGNLTIEDTFADENCIRIAVPINASKEWSNVLYIDGYISVNPDDYSGWQNNRSDFSVGYLSTYEYVIVKDSSCGSKSGFESKLNEKYLYYKLATPITMNIDGNEVTERLNESLGDYGLDNKFDGELQQGYYKAADGTFSNSTSAVCSKNYISCKKGDNIRIKTNTVYGNIYAIAYDSDGTFLGNLNTSNTNDWTFTETHDNVAYIKFNIIHSSNITPQTVGAVSVYINNAIDELKNDLSKKVYSKKVNSSLDMIVEFFDVSFTNGNASIDLTDYIPIGKKLVTTIAFAQFRADERNVISAVHISGNTLNIRLSDTSASLSNNISVMFFVK